jgi:hypothetical protein
MIQALVPMLLASVALADATQEGASLKVRVDEAIRRLGADRPEEREQAVQDLKGLGRAALPDLRAALPEIRDADVKGRVAQVIRKLDPFAFEVLEEYFAKAGIDVVAIDVLQDPAVQKALPRVIFFQIWKRGLVNTWKILGFDDQEKTLFDATEPGAWAPYARNPKRDAAAVEKARQQVVQAAAAPHGSLAVYAPAPTTCLFLKLDKREINVWVKADGHTLEARSLEGKPLWETDLEKACGRGTPVIRFLTFDRGKLSIVFGKSSFASVDLKSGKLSGIGAD